MHRYLMFFQRNAFTRSHKVQMQAFHLIPAQLNKITVEENGKGFHMRRFSAEPQI